MFNEEYLNMLNNIIDGNNLQSNLSFIALYIALYENFTYTVKESIHGFYCMRTHIENDGTIRYVDSPEYKSKIINRIIDDNGNKDTLKSSMLWFVDQGAISIDEYVEFLKMKKQRNRFVHDMSLCLLNGTDNEEIGIFFDLFALYKKINKWWIIEIEIPCSGEYHPKSYKQDDVESAASILFKTMIDVLCNNKSEEFKKYS